VLYGVFVRDPGGSLSFVAGKAPKDTEVEALLQTVQKRVLRMLVRRGWLSDAPSEQPDETELPPLHAVYAASVRQQVATGPRAGQAVLRLRSNVETAPSRPNRPRHARLGGVDLHADTQVQANNRPRLERLCRYLLRPAIAEDRLSYASNGRVRLRLKTPWSDGTHHIVLQPQELLEKLAALIPRPYVNLIVYHGVLAPNAKWRAEVVQFARGRTPHAQEVPSTTSDEAYRPSNRSWAELMRRGLDLDVLQCPNCGGRMRFIATILSTGAIRKILRHLGLPADPVELAPVRAPPDLEEAWAC
jgi:hypothetical protein